MTKDEKGEALIKKFRLSNRHIFLTYKTHLPKDSMKKMFEGLGAARVEICHETGKDDKENPYPHSHIYVDFGKIFTCSRQNIFDILTADGPIHPHIAPIKGGDAGVKKVLNYMSKEDPECAHLADKKKVITLASAIWNCSTKQEVLELAQKPSDVTGLLALYANRPIQNKDDDLKLNSWQQELWNSLQKHPDDRTVIWVRDEKGGVGKSKFCTWMHRTKQAYMLKALSGQYHTAPIIAGALENGWDSKILLVDLTRSMCERDIYDPLEAIKDGVLTTVKYLGKTIDFKSPHVVVFANWWPDVTKLSLDRWCLWDITKCDAGRYNINRPLVQSLLPVEDEKINK